MKLYLVVSPLQFEGKKMGKKKNGIESDIVANIHSTALPLKSIFFEGVLRRTFPTMQRS